MQGYIALPQDMTVYGCEGEGSLYETYIQLQRGETFLIVGDIKIRKLDLLDTLVVPFKLSQSSHNTYLLLAAELTGQTRLWGKRWFTSYAQAYGGRTIQARAEAMVHANLMRERIKAAWVGYLTEQEQQPPPRQKPELKLIQGGLK